MFFYIMVLTVHNLEHMLKYIFVLYLFLQNYVSNSIFTRVLCHMLSTQISSRCLLVVLVFSLY